MNRAELIVNLTSPPNPIFDSPLPQKFSLPPTFIHYIAKTSKSLKIYQTCKYFYSKYPFVAFHHLNFYDRKNPYWTVGSMRNPARAIYEFSLSNFKYKIILIQALRISSLRTSNLASLLSRKIMKCNVADLYLGHQTITFNEFLIFTSSKNLQRIKFGNVTVTNNDGSLVQFETILANLTKIKTLNYEPSKISQINSKTSQIIAEFRIFEKLEYFFFYEIPETLELNAFFDFMKKHTKTNFYLGFCKNISEAYNAKIKNFAKDLKKAPFIKSPKIYYPGVRERYKIYETFFNYEK